MRNDEIRGENKQIGNSTVVICQYFSDVGTIKFDTHVDVILGEALPQVVDVGVPNPVVVRAGLDWVTLTPHLAQVVGSNLFGVASISHWHSHLKR